MARCAAAVSSGVSGCLKKCAAVSSRLYVMRFGASSRQSRHNAQLVSTYQAPGTFSGCLLSVSAICFNRRTADRESHFRLTGCVAILIFSKTAPFFKIWLCDCRVSIRRSRGGCLFASRSDYGNGVAASAASVCTRSYPAPASFQHTASLKKYHAPKIPTVAAVLGEGAESDEASDRMG